MSPFWNSDSVWALARLVTVTWPVRLFLDSHVFSDTSCVLPSCAWQCLALQASGDVMFRLHHSLRPARCRARDQLERAAGLGEPVDGRSGPDERRVERTAEQRADLVRARVERLQGELGAAQLLGEEPLSDPDQCRRVGALGK